MLANEFWHPQSALQEGCDFYVPDDRSSLTAKYLLIRPGLEHGGFLYTS